MSEEKFPVWQKLMDAAYDKWPESGGHREMLNRATDAERCAVLLGNLNYQVENGGFCQWIDNGYGLRGLDVADVLERVRIAPTTPDDAKPVIEELRVAIKKLMSYVDLNIKDRGFNDYWLRDLRYLDDDYDADYNEDRHPGAVYAQSLDDWFYDTVQPHLRPAIEQFLKSLTGEQPCQPDPSSPR